MNEAVGGAEVSQRRQPPDKILRRQNPARADQAVDLDEEGKERDQVDRAERAEKDGAGEAVRCGASLRADDDAIDPIDPVAMSCDKGVDRLADPAEERQVTVEPKQVAISLRVCQRAKH